MRKVKKKKKKNNQNKSENKIKKKIFDIWHNLQYSSIDPARAASMRYIERASMSFHTDTSTCIQALWCSYSE